MAPGRPLRARLTLGAALVAAALAVLPGPAPARADGACRPLRAIFYAATGPVGLAQALAANASPCAQYYVSVPPLSGDKTQMRVATAGPIRALGPSFHALAEINVTAWGTWVASTGSSWYQAGVEARRRMAAAGFDVAAGDSWVVNELSSAARVGTGATRQNMRDLVRGLYDGDGGPPAKGVVFVTGIGQAIGSVDTYKARLESWLQDSAFWSDMSAYVSDFLQENYGDVRDYAVAGADVPTRLGYLNQYLEHPLQLAAVAPPQGAAAASYLAGSYGALANAAWAWSSAFGFTAVPVDVMQDYVTAQVAAMRSYEASLGWSGDRIGFAWDPSNTLGLSAADFNAQQAQLEARLGTAIAASADPGAPGTAACVAPWCAAAVAGAAFTSVWGAFGSWTPASTGFVTTPVTVVAGGAGGPITVQPQIGPIAVTLPYDATVTVSSSSPGGTFSTSAGGPWSPTLQLTVPAGAAAATFYMLDAQPGTPTVTASLEGQSSSQVEVVAAPAAPLALGGGGNTVTFVLGGAPVAVDPALAVTDAASPNLVSASVVITSGLDPGDVLAAAPAAGIAASYANGTLTLTGTAPVAAYQAVLQGVTFTGSTSTGGARNILWTASDGASTASAVTTLLYTAAPSAPAGISAAAGNGSATVTFGAPASDGGSPITLYTVTASPGGATATGDHSPVTVGGLANGTSYTFTVTATNAAGTGPMSSPSNAVTPAAPAAGGGGGGGSAGPTTPPVPTPAPTPAGSTPPPVTPPPLQPPTPARAPAVRTVVSVVSAVKPVQLGGKRPLLVFTVRASRAAAVTVTLKDARARTVATWHRSVHRGSQRLSLVLPAKARHAGAKRLQLVWRGGKSRLLPVVLRAAR